MEFPHRFIHEYDSFMPYVYEWAIITDLTLRNVIFMNEHEAREGLIHRCVRAKPRPRSTTSTHSSIFWEIITNYGINEIGVNFSMYINLFDNTCTDLSGTERRIDHLLKLRVRWNHLVISSNYTLRYHDTRVHRKITHPGIRLEITKINYSWKKTQRTRTDNYIITKRFHEIALLIYP